MLQKYLSQIPKGGKKSSNGNHNIDSHIGTHIDSYDSYFFYIEGISKEFLYCILRGFSHSTMYTFSHRSLCEFFKWNLFSNPSRFYLIWYKNTCLKSSKVVRKVRVQITILITHWNPHGFRIWFLSLFIEVILKEFLDSILRGFSQRNMFTFSHRSLFRFFRGTYLITQVGSILFAVEILVSNPRRRYKKSSSANRNIDHTFEPT